MRHSSLVRTLAILTLLGLFLALPPLAGCKGDEGISGSASAGNDAESEQYDAGGVQDAGESGDAGNTEGAVEGGSADGVSPGAAAEITVRLFWVQAGESALGVERTVARTQSVATDAMNALLAGPSPQEQATWPAIGSAIPAGTKLLGLIVVDSVAKIDLSSEFRSGGGTFSVTARLAQIVYTLDQFPTIDAVEFYIDGARVEMFSGEGLILEGPQTLDDYDQLLPLDT